MTLSHGFRRLANALETLEANGLRVRDVATTDDEPSERLTVDLTVTVPLDGTELPEDASVTDDATASDAVGSGDDESERSGGPARERVLDALAVSAAATNGATQIQPTDDEIVDCPVEDCDATFESDHGMKIHRTKVHGDETGGSDAATPAYRDPDRLREVYDACDSFTEMREALETDVSTQTVRRQMIAHDIYEPGESSAESGSPADDDEAVDSDDGSESVLDDEAEGSVDPDGRRTDAEGSIDADDEDESSGDEHVVEDQLPAADEQSAEGAQSDEDAQTAEEPQLDEDAQTAAEEEATDDHPELDAIELPEGVSVADLKAAVSSAQTLYHVQQRFDLDRKEAMQLLETYDLLELVHGRVSNRDARKEIGEDEITRRILEHAPVTEPSRA